VPDEEEADNNDEEIVLPDKIGTLVAESQRAEPADRVVVTRVAADLDGWVAIYAQRGEGELLGYEFVEAGETANLTIELERELRADELLLARLHVDRGRGEVFEFPGPDGPATDSDGELLARPFRILSVDAAPEPQIGIDSDIVDGPQTLLVEAVTAPRPAWLVALDDDGSVLGTTLLETGDHRDVTVSLDRVLRDRERIELRLHADAPQDDRFEWSPQEDDIDPPLRRSGRDEVLAVGFIVPEGPVVRASDQILEFEDRVFVNARIDADGWIVVHERDPDASRLEPGAVLGHTAIDAGDRHIIQIALDRELVDGEQLVAVLVYDRGAEGTLEYPGGADVTVTARGGSPLVDGFRVHRPRPEVTLGRRNIVAGAMTYSVDRVVVPEAGWLVVHEQGADGGVGDPIGYTAVPFGRSNNVEVSLDRDPVDGTRLYGRVHHDDPADGVFSYDGGVVDRPYALRGVPVQDSVLVNVLSQQ
jgi:hypothetical protein